MQEWNTESHDAIYYSGHLVITNKANNKCGIVRLNDINGRDITLKQFRNGIKTHGIDKTISVFAKLVPKWE